MPVLKEYISVPKVPAKSIQGKQNATGAISHTISKHLDPLHLAPSRPLWGDRQICCSGKVVLISIPTLLPRIMPSLLGSPVENTYRIQSGINGE